MGEHLNSKDLAKYFIHGIAFSLLFFVLAFVLVFVLGFLIAIGSIIGLVIGLGILMLVVGGLNGFLANAIWGIETTESFLSLFIHGVVLFLCLLVIHLFFVIGPQVAFPGIATTIVTFIIGAFIDGFIGKHVAALFEE